MQIKPKILQGLKPEMTYITGMKNTINPFIKGKSLLYAQT